MLRTRRFVLALPLVILSSIPSLGADSTAIGTLKGKGLTRSGRFFVLAGEEAVVEKWKRTRAILAEHAAAVERKDQAEQAAGQVAQLEERRVELQERLNDLNQQINEQGLQQANIRPGGFGQGTYLSQLSAQRNMIRMNLAEIASMQNSVKADAGGDKKALEAESQKTLEAARAALKEMREAADAVTKRYDQLGSDASVRSAFQALEKDKLGTFKLGPTAPFKAAVKALENAERTVLAKKPAAASRKKGKSRK